MKKRLLSALLALALVFVLLPTTALAEETTYSDSEITISGKYWNFGNKGTSGEYAPVYFRSNGTAFEESEPTGSNYLEIRKTSANEITIKVHGTVDLTEDKNSTNSCISVNSAGMNKRNLIITGAAKGSTLNLTCKNNSHPLYSYEGSITINGGVTVNATSQYSNNNNNVSVYGIQVSDGHNLTISGANTKVNVANKTYDSTVKVDGNITVSDGAQLKAENKSGKVTGYTSKKAYAIECGGQLSISGDKTQVTADTSNGKQAISGTVSDGDKLTFKVQLYLASSTLYQKPMDEALKYTHVVITQAPTDPYVRIAGEPAIMGQETPIPGGTGTYLYKKTTYNGSFLTLKGVDITGTKNGPAQAIRFGKNGYYTIELEGENKISGFSSGIVAPNDSGVNDVKVVLSGSGSLDISANQYAIDMQVGNLKFENTGEIKLTTGYVFTLPLNALRVKSGSIIIDNTKYDIVGVKQDKDGTREDISDNPNLDTILKGTSTDKDLYFKSITITPAAAKPSTISYNGKTLKQGETITDGNGGTATVDSENNTITLNNFNGTALSFDATLADSTLVLEGTNTLSSIVTTQMGLTISGSGSLTVGSIRVTNNDNISADLTITGGAHVTVNRPSEDKPAVEVSGNLTVTGEGTQLSAECTAATNPAIEVGGNVTISGNPGTNAYTVKAYNKYDTPRDRDDKLRPSQMPSAFEISGNLSISGSAQVMAQTDSDGAAVWMPKEKVISVVDASLIAQNSSHNFSTISFGDGSDMGNIYAKGQVNIVAENMLHSSSSLAHRAIKAFIYNHYSTGDSNPYYINVVSEGVQSGGKVNVIPGHCTSTGGYKVTITRGDAYTTPQVAANYTIAGQTMYVGKYYKTDANGNITDGTARDYNIYCDSENDFTLNNATISSTGTGGSTGVIMTNLNASSNEIHIKLIGTNSINNAGHHAILGEGAYSTIFIENAENASNASLTISGNYLPVYSYGNVTINAEVVIKNTNGNLISTNKDGHANGAFDLGSGYKCYASTSTTGNLLEEFNSANYSTYKYLRVTTLTLETGGGSTHQHVWDEAWHDTGDYHHAHQCTICKAYDTTTQELHNVTGHRDNHDGSHSNICGSCGYSAKVSHSYTWAPNANDNEKHIGTCVCGNVVEKNHNFVGDVCSDCGYDKSTGTTCEHVWTTEWTIDTVDNEYHWHKCIKCNAITDKKPHAYTIVTDSGTNHIRECECKVFYVEDHISSDWIIDTPATATTAGSMHKECTVCKHKMQTEVIPATGEIEPPTPDNPGTIVIIRPAEEEKPAQQPNPSTGANDLVGLAVAAAVAAALGSAALLRKHD
jgi:ribosomal protein L37E